MSDNKLEYAALSYVWGEAKEGNYIICNGQRLPVTDNSHNALIHLRRELRPRRLWVDAICIDQTASNASIRERNHQVQRMGQVYHCATQVLIWLDKSGSE